MSSLQLTILLLFVTRKVFSQTVTGGTNAINPGLYEYLGIDSDKDDPNEFSGVYIKISNPDGGVNDFFDAIFNDPVIDGVYRGEDPDCAKYETCSRIKNLEDWVDWNIEISTIVSFNYFDIRVRTITVDFPDGTCSGTLTVSDAEGNENSQLISNTQLSYSFADPTSIFKLDLSLNCEDVTPTATQFGIRLTTTTIGPTGFDTVTSSFLTQFTVKEYTYAHAINYDPNTLGLFYTKIEPTQSLNDADTTALTTFLNRGLSSPFSFTTSIAWNYADVQRACSWTGIACKSIDGVIYINTIDLSLLNANTNQLTLDNGGFSQLEVLRLDATFLTRNNFENAIFALGNLRIFTMSRQNNWGSISVNFLENIPVNLPNLEKLDFSSNQGDLSEIPITDGVIDNTNAFMLPLAFLDEAFLSRMTLIDLTSTGWSGFLPTSVKPFITSNTLLIDEEDVWCGASGANYFDVTKCRPPMISRVRNFDDDFNDPLIINHRQRADTVVLDFNSIDGLSCVPNQVMLNLDGYNHYDFSPLFSSNQTTPSQYSLNTLFPNYNWETFDATNDKLRLQVSQMGGACQYPGWGVILLITRDTKCPIGEFPALSTPKLCTPCAKGRFSTTISTDSYVCQYCQAGSALNATGETSCEDCTPGKFEGNIGGSSCKLCSTVGFGTDEEQVRCTQCAPGTFSSAVEGTNLFECIACVGNFYQDAFGQSECKVCPVNTNTLVDNTICNCPIGFIGSGNPLENCIPCGNRQGVVCNQMDQKYPIIESGWWYAGTAEDPFKVVQCVPAVACASTDTSGVTTCSEGYTGQVCSECVQYEYFRLGEQCEKCPNASYVLWVLIFFVVAFLALAMLIFAKPRPFKATSVGIVVTWVQIIALFESLPLQWPESVRQMYNSISIVNFNIEIFAPDCSVPMSFKTKWFLKLSIPLLVVLMLLFVFAVQKVLFLLAKKSPFVGRHLKNFKGIEFRRFVYSVSLIMLWTYTLLCSTVFNPLKCIEQSDGTWVMQSSTSTVCFDEDYYKEWIPWIVTFFLLYVMGIPLATAFILWRNRYRLQSKQFLSYFGGVTLPYRDQFFWFELMNLSRKACIVILIDFFYIISTDYLQIFIMLGALFGFLIAQVTLDPYKLQVNNFLGFAWIIVAVFCLFSGLVFPNNSVQPFEKEFFEYIVIIIFSLGCAFSVHAFIVEQRMVYDLKTKGLISMKSFLDKWSVHHSSLSRVFPQSQSCLENILSLSATKEQEILLDELDDLDLLDQSDNPQDFLTANRVRWSSVGSCPIEKATDPLLEHATVENRIVPLDNDSSGSVEK